MAPPTAPPHFLHRRSVSYTDPPGRLQTLDIYLPHAPSAPSAPWLVYVHGGAWRDPAQTSSCADATIKHLSTSYPSTLAAIAGIASVNYRLSPYTSHPTSPSSPTDPQRNARHPQHLADVRAAMRLLAAHHGLQTWIGVGHSCGATLLLQLVASIGVPLAPLPAPRALVLLEGIYDLPLLLRNHAPPACPPAIADIYRDFVCGAFGDEAGYAGASPVAGTYVAETWERGGLVVLAHSAEDELVEEEQRAVMARRLEEEGWTLEEGSGKRTVELRDLKGGHDEIWEDGSQIAELIAEVVGMQSPG